MTLASAFVVFRERLQALGEILRQLALALDDVPESDGSEPAVVESLRGHAADVEGELAAAVAITGAASHDRTSIAIAAMECQSLINSIWRAFGTELATFDVIAEIERAGAERGAAWPRWKAVVREDLERCQLAIFEAADALAACSRELVEQPATK
ncbi:MAG TPA: hypothetical protein VN181_02465 [Thermoanaerobaculia bacterium]|nr:hypothetical protein [Thermoanaerobaculia bacterium]